LKLYQQSLLYSAIIAALASPAAYSQQAAEPASAVSPGLYVTVSQSEVYIIQGDQQIDLKVGEAAFAGQDSMHQLDEVPAFLNWPCGGSSEDGLVPTYTMDSLPPNNRINEIAKRFFEGPEIPDSTPAWLNGESHGSFPAEEIERFSSRAYWYKSGDTTAKMVALRPEILLISLYPNTQQIVVDGNHLEELRALYGSDDIPVTFIFNEENVVPVSYFGKNVTMKKVADAFFKDGLSVADTPMWYAGDRQLATSPAQIADLLQIPPLEEIDPERLAALVADLQTNGFTKKPINISLMAQNGLMVVDEGERVRAAQSIGMDSIPIVFFYFNENSHAKHCGLPIPQIGAGLGGGQGGVSAVNANVSAAESLIAQENLASQN